MTLPIRPDGRKALPFPMDTETLKLRSVLVERYVTPLREGGSMPAIVETDDLGTYVLKFRGAGQGVRALMAEIISGGMARALGLPVPEIVLLHLNGDLSRTESDPEIQDLIRASDGLNVGLDYLPGSINFDPAVDVVDDDFASRLVWFDTLVSNVDRTARNTNMLMYQKQPWLIDHGASLTFHHAWNGVVADPAKPLRPVPSMCCCRRPASWRSWMRRWPPSLGPKCSRASWTRCPTAFWSRPLPTKRAMCSGMCRPIARPM